MPRILIVRLSAIGDTIHGLPVLCALRRKFPRAFLGWVVEEHAAALLEEHPDLDALIRVPRGWLNSPREVLRLRRRLRSLRFDTTVDLQSLTKSSVAAWLSGARRRLGAGGTHGREISKWLNNEPVPLDAHHVIEHYLQIAAPLGLEQQPAVEYRLPRHAAEEAWADAQLTELGLAAGRFAILNVGAGWPSKLWIPERYAALADYLDDRHDISSLVMWAGDSERALAQVVVANSRRAIAAPPNTMRQLAALCRRSCLFVGSDTGPVHLAVAVGIPSISLHGPTRASWTGAYGESAIRLQASYHDGSTNERRGADTSAMNAIEVEMVCDACDRLLAHAAAA